MSFVEGISAGQVDIADPAFVLCVGGIVLLVMLLLAPPVVATALRFLHLQRSLDRIFWYLKSLFGRSPKV